MGQQVAELQLMTLSPEASTALTLLSRAARPGAAVPPLPPEVVEDERVVQWLSSRKIDSLLFLAVSPDRIDQAIYDKVWREQRRELGRVLAALGAADVTTAVFKGAEFIERNFAGHSLNLIADLDLLFRREDLQKVKATLYSLGYHQSFYNRETGALVDRDVSDIGSMESTHYELAPFHRLVPLSLTERELAIVKSWDRSPVWIHEGSCHLDLEIDAHHAVALDIETAPLFERLVPSVFPQAMTLCNEDHLWFTLTRLYNEVALHDKTSLRDFAYIGPLLSQSIDWKAVINAAHQYQIHCPLFYYLNFLHYLSKGKVPREVLVELNPCNHPRPRDWGWQLEKLLNTITVTPFLAT